MKKHSSKYYYDQNPASKAKKSAYNAEYNKSAEATAGRVEDNKANREAGTYGNGDGLDYQKKGKDKGKMVSASKNRARNEKSRLKGSKNSNFKGQKKAKGYKMRTNERDD